ncbi:beta-lactamase domain protein [Paenibacillus curdlanolyticus YK9]|uniref:Beta-lactamase domain protein n=1 Tax=Paenibacillus curdlanolyticus YK9 TaxID=717606 RepID=E0I652_9BACL|nr:MBL fold metallo-hydrolase [Paenibacillus curdlanolyticus]EFM12444.1 beta-lactamase domain protein [Paenibacillus curdlanolyticus YK9]
MRIAEGIYQLSVTAMAMGQPSTVHPVLIYDEKEAVLVDTGYPGRLTDLIEGIASAGSDAQQLRAVIITHQDIDHIGGLPDLLAHLARPVDVLAHELEKPYIEGERRLIKITDEVLANVDAMIPPEVPEQWRKAFKAMLEHPPSAPVDRLIKGGDRIPLCGGIIVIDTPGHTPGHISLYHEASRTLIAGDALVVENGELSASDPQLASDYGQAMLSLEQLAAYPISHVVCHHGGYYTSDDVNGRIAAICAAYQAAHAKSSQ